MKPSLLRPDFGKKFFEKHQTQLVAFLNSRLGHWFFKLSKLDIPKDWKVMQVFPNAVSGDWKLVDGRLQKTTVFLTSNRFQRRLEHVYARAVRLLGIGAAEALFKPAELGFGLALPLFALTSDTFFPDPNPETSSVDGEVRHVYTAGSGQTWATIIGAAGSVATDSAVTFNAADIRSDSGSGNWIRNSRAIILFDTSSLPDTDTVDSATLSLFGSAKQDTYTTPIAPDVNIYGSTPASNTALASTDYAQTASTAFSSAISYASFSTVAYNDFALNASGLAAITATGVSKFSAKNANYDVAASSPTWEATKIAQLTAVAADTAGTSSDPKLVVVHSTPVPAPSVFDAITITEAVTMMVDEDPNVNDSVTVTEAVTMESDMPVNVFDDVTISESVTLEITGGPQATETITVSEDVSVVIEQLVPSVGEDVTVTESVTLTVSADRIGLVHMRSNEQSYPLMMDEDEVR